MQHLATITDYLAWAVVTYPSDTADQLRSVAQTSSVATFYISNVARVETPRRVTAFRDIATAWLPPRRPFKHANSPELGTLADPYTEAEQQKLVQWVEGVKSPYLRQAAAVWVGLTIGSGLSTTEIVHLRYGDTRILDGNLFVSTPYRNVQVDEPWASYLTSRGYLHGDREQWIVQPRSKSPASGRTLTDTVKKLRSAANAERPYKNRMIATYKAANHS